LTVRNEFESFWLLKSDWPLLDPKNSIFLGRAVNVLGKATWPEIWTSEEPSAPSIFPLPDDRAILPECTIPSLKHVRDMLLKRVTKEFDSLAQQDAFRARFNVLDEWNYEDTLDDIERIDGRVNLSSYYSDEVWLELLTESKRLRSQYSQERKRWGEIKRKIATLILHEEVGYMIRHPFSGQMEAGNSADWNLDTWPAFFEYCQMGTFCSDYYEEKPGYIFLKQDDLKRVAEKLQPKASEQASWMGNYILDKADPPRYLMYQGVQPCPATI